MKKLISNLSAIILFIVILLSIGLIIRSINNSNLRYEEYIEIETLEFTGQYSFDGQVYENLNANTEIDINKGETIVLVGRFNKLIEDEEILFTINNFKFEMRVNGACIAEYGQAGTYPEFVKTSGFSRNMYSIEYISPEDVIEIELTYPYDVGGNTAFYEFMNKIYVGEKSDFYLMYINEYGLPFLIVTTIIFISFFSFIASILLGLWKNVNGLRFLYFLVFVTSGGVWFFMDSFYVLANLVMPYATIINIISMINLLFIPISAIFFLSSFLDNSITKKISSILKVGQLIYVLVIIMLQFYGIKDIYESNIGYIPISAVLCFIVFVAALYEYVRDKNKILLSAVITLLPTAIGAVADIVIHYNNPRGYRYLFRIGFILSCCIQLIMSIKLFNQNLEVKERERKLKEQLTDNKVSIMLSQIQPHFLYNALNAIQYICMEDAQKAVKAIEHFSKYLRGNMDSLKQKELIPFKKEINHLENYLYIEYLRFGDRVKVKYDLKVTDFLVPCLIIQPIVENAIRYGITRKVEGGTINIVTRECDSDIMILISDDGIGFNPQKTQYDKRSHIGIDNVRDRLKLQCNGTLNVMSVENVGTTITIKIPKEGVMMI